MEIAEENSTMTLVRGSVVSLIIPSVTIHLPVSLFDAQDAIQSGDFQTIVLQVCPGEEFQGIGFVNSFGFVEPFTRDSKTLNPCSIKSLKKKQVLLMGRL